MSEQDNLQEADGKKEVTASVENNEDSTTTKHENLDKPEDTETDDKVISEIEESNAEDAEDEGNIDRHSIEKKDYEKMSLDALADELENLVKNQKVQAIKTHVEEIRSEFKSKFSSLLDEKKEEFLNEGGNEIDFFYSNPTQKRYKDAIKEYRSNLNAHYKGLEKSLKDNLAERLEIIEEIKGLINVEENINTTYKHFKDLQERWRKAGPIPRDKYNNAWNSYHHHVEIFYDFLHLNRDLRDLDFKHNLEQKTKIIERAEELAQDDNHNRAFRELQVLHKMWKEELGPVDKEHREGIWKRFKAATKKIHDKRQVYFDQLDIEFEKNLENKKIIIEKITIIGDKGAKTHSEWQKKIKEVEALRNEFFEAGKVPIKVNEATWASFKTAVRKFNKKKNSYYKDLKKDQYDNLQKKQELIKIAEDNKDSDDFEATTPLMKKIQSDWKKIGHVPRKNSDKIWNQFKAACNHYFDRLHAAKNEANKEEIEAYEAKVKLLEEIKSLEFSGNKETDLETIKIHIEKWKAIGNVPSNKRYIEGKLNKTLDVSFKSLKLNKTEAELIKFDNKLETLNNAEDSRHLDNERSFISKKINEVKSEINQLENNLQFFTNVDESNPLVKDVIDNVKKQKEALELWKTKLRKIKELY
ncbi:DUF349 domain-containing protein [Xanthomarina sp. F1114]|uniref:DUF349 domain-containing protein n=1 Tax=Xanthomarina sp. F1114 TaxID=2996019 RepID=UPI00225E52AF|nr:DUF349 domain-containing protein [Xanthomarina sp. F1114]MCX7547140.1 DUF349 domain-containing protein [Xanthomarina sp. F1114]